MVRVAVMVLVAVKVGVIVFVSVSVQVNVKVRVTVFVCDTTFVAVNVAVGSGGSFGVFIFLQANMKTSDTAAIRKIACVFFMLKLPVQDDFILPGNRVYVLRGVYGESRVKTKNIPERV
jgi:hypothetical protein